MLFDTDREKDIFLGTDYPFGPQQAGQCLVTTYEQDAMNLEIN